MKPGQFNLSYAGDSLSASIAVRSSLSAKILLYSLNILFLSIIILFTIGGIGIIVLFIVAFEVLFLRYTLWNLYGSETITLRKNSLSYQLGYGPIRLPVKSLPVYKLIHALPVYETSGSRERSVKVIFESRDERGEPVNLRQTALIINEDDYLIFMKSFNRFLEDNFGLK